MQRERWPEMFIKGETRDLQVSKEGVRKMLARSMQMYEKVWGLQLPAVPAEATDADTRSRLPIANAPGQLTLVGVIGAALLDAGGELTKDSMKLLQPLLDDFTAARINVTGPLVKQILKDIEAYDEEYAAQVASAPDGTLERLAASAAIVKQQQKDELAMEVVVEMARDAAAPPATDSLEYCIYAQSIASGVMPHFYELASSICLAATAGAGAHVKCLPASIKGLRRIVSKSMSKYGNFAQCHDMARLTIQVRDLDTLADILEAAVASERLKVIRCKNRFDRSHNAIPDGGYRDVQLQVLVLFQGVWRYCEMQINLERMIQIKSGEADASEGGAAGVHGVAKKRRSVVDHELLSVAGGHGALDLARSIDAFNPRTLRYKGMPNPAVFNSIAVGALLELDLSKANLGKHDARGGMGSMLSFLSDEPPEEPEVARPPGPAEQLNEALLSPQCRLTSLRLNSCSLHASVLATIGGLLSDGRLPVKQLDLGSNHGSGGGLFSDESVAERGWTSLFQGIATNTTVELLDVSLSAIGDVGLIALGAALPSNMRIVDLNLRSVTGAIFARGSDKGWIGFAAGLGANTGIQKLSLDSNKIRLDGALALVRALEANQTVAELGFAGNPFGPEGGLAVAKMLETNKTLVNLSMGDCRLDNASARAVKAAWGDRGSIRLSNMFDSSGMLKRMAPPSGNDIGRMLAGMSEAETAKLMSQMDNSMMGRAAAESAAGR